MNIVLPSITTETHTQTQHKKLQKKHKVWLEADSERGNEATRLRCLLHVTCLI